MSAALQETDKKHACFGGAWYAGGCLRVLGSLCAFGELECVGAQCLERSVYTWGSARTARSECLGICVFGKLPGLKGVPGYLEPRVFWGLLYGGIYCV